MRRCVTIALATAVALFAHASPAASNDVGACSAAIGERPEVPGVQVEDAPGATDDLPALKVTVAATGAHMRVFYDPVSEPAARARAACFGQQLVLLAAELVDDRQDAEWFSVVFTSSSDYVPPRGDGVKARFAVVVGPGGELSESSNRVILTVIPHEQVHDYQHRVGARPPRWFGEGHAAWIASRVTAALNATAARTERESLRADLAAATAPLQLAEWGSVRPRREAFMRQVSAEDRAKMEADPDYIPAGTFRFSSADLIGDESNMEARYAAALAVFETLAERHGPEVVQAWAAEVTSSPGPVSPDALSQSVQRRFGVSLDELLDDR